MKTILLSTLSSVAIAFAGSLSGAENHPCHSIREACSKAGFIPGAAKTNKGLVKNCLDVVLKGGSVPGVEIPAEELKACQQKMETRKKK